MTEFKDYTCPNCQTVGFTHSLISLYLVFKNSKTLKIEMPHPAPRFLSFPLGDMFLLLIH